MLTGSVVVACVVALVGVLTQPWLEQWGSTPVEQARTLPGDDIVAAPEAVYTRAITIDTPPAAIWAWLIQMGQDKGGFYSFDWAETLFTDPMRNATTIHPEWQDLAVGDLVHPFPPERGLPPWRVRALDEHRLLILATDDDTWSLSFELRPVDGQRTRLVTRFRSEPNWMNVALGPADLIVFPRLLVGLEQRAEANLPGMPGTDVGAPLPTARLPVNWWAALTWLVGLAAVGALLGRVLGVWLWRRRRPHPGITIGIVFVAGAAYAIMSDTPPSQFLVRNWALGLLAAVLLGFGIARRSGVSEPSGRWSRLARGVVAAVETGLFVIVPVTAVWQAATAQGWTTTLPARLAVGLVAVTAALGVAAAVTVVGQRTSARRLIVPTVLAAGFVLTGSGLVPLLGSAVIELAPARRGGVDL